MLNGRCPRCNSNGVYKHINGVVTGDKHVYVRGIGFSSPRTDRMTYVCAACGYYENYLTDKAILKKLAEKWEKA